MGKRSPSGPLRIGFSTGTAASAAAKGALLAWLGLPCPETVEVPLPMEGSLTIPLARHGRVGDAGECLVIKDAGDDPDVTHGAEIGARVRALATSGSPGEIRLVGGEGVGRITKPGLPLPKGEPAINPVPRQMIRRVVRDITGDLDLEGPKGWIVEIFVPRGEELARYTLNPRLGIIGGISILGTTGLVKPYSHEAYRATILSGLQVARAMGHRRVVFSTGGKSEGYAQRQFQAFPEEVFVQMGDYVKFSIQKASQMGFKEMIVVAFFGKAVKMAQGLANTHASRGQLDLESLAYWTMTHTGDPRLAHAVAGANTARGALEILMAAQANGVMEEVGMGMLRALRQYAAGRSVLEAIILDFSGRPLWQDGLKGGESA